MAVCMIKTVSGRMETERFWGCQVEASGSKNDRSLVSCGHLAAGASHIAHFLVCGLMCHPLSSQLCCGGGTSCPLEVPHPLRGVAMWLQSDGWDISLHALGQGGPCCHSYPESRRSIRPVLTSTGWAEATSTSSLAWWLGRGCAYSTSRPYLPLIPTTLRLWGRHKP